MSANIDTYVAQIGRDTQISSKTAVVLMRAAEQQSSRAEAHESTDVGCACTVKFAEFKALVS